LSAGGPPAKLWKRVVSVEIWGLTQPAPASARPKPSRIAAMRMRSSICCCAAKHIPKCRSATFGWRGAGWRIAWHVMSVEALSAVTLATHDMARAVRFYRALGFVLDYGGEDAAFTSFRAGAGHLNITAEAPQRDWSWWGRAIFHVDDVDRLYRRALEAGLTPQAPPLLPHHRPRRPRDQLRPTALSGPSDGWLRQRRVRRRAAETAGAPWCRRRAGC
jgi:catechol 2,3-dioxygenase-like lactoylglutathione lyase family enzyme